MRSLPPLVLALFITSCMAGLARAAEAPAAFGAGLLDHLGVDKVSGVGVSSGGTTCMYLAAT
jgi:pimeloyl-ACP methyl ester carboxylesterase